MIHPPLITKVMVATSHVVIAMEVIKASVF
jgi:hypothetical protein